MYFNTHASPFVPYEEFNIFIPSILVEPEYMHHSDMGKNAILNQIYEVFYMQQIGTIKKTDLVLKMKPETGQQYYCAYITVQLYPSQATTILKRNIDVMGHSRVYYNQSKYWVFMKNEATKKTQAPRTRPRTRIDLSDMKQTQGPPATAPTPGQTQAEEDPCPDISKAQLWKELNELRQGIAKLE